MSHKQCKTAKPKFAVNKDHNNAQRHSFECIALLLQGGGALGAYQAGVYQALSEAGLEPDWVAGISIGAINAAIIAGNSPEQRLSKLREFWEFITIDTFKYSPAAIKSLMTHNLGGHQVLNIMSAFHTIMIGIPGFFTPRIPGFKGEGSIEATSFYDSASLKTTLERFVDFDRINNGDIHFSIGAVNVKSGNFTDFDNKKDIITPEHIMASGALPPGLPPVKIGDDYYWDGGLISNTPLQWVVDNKFTLDTLIFQVDLWSAEGGFPQNMPDVLTRAKAIQYSSRTRANTDRFKDKHELGHTIASLLEKLPADLKQLPEVKRLSARSSNNVYNIVHLIYRKEADEGLSKDFEFSRLSMEERWAAGYQDTLNTLKHPQILQRPPNCDCIAIFDFSRGEKGKDTALSTPHTLQRKPA
ncbi:MAG: DUF3734 domain-containing protein [Rickettsiales bacterium]|nr:DUF3734 domain-containing protein [Rickettsiales bacterium]